MENNTDNKKILKGGQKVVKTVWKMPQTRIKQGKMAILLIFLNNEKTNQ